MIRCRHSMWTEEAKQWFTDHLGIEGLGVADVWSDEVKKARAEEKKMKMPKRGAASAGSTGIEGRSQAD